MSYQAYSPFSIHIDGYTSSLFITFIAGEFPRLDFYNMLEFLRFENLLVAAFYAEPQNVDPRLLLEEDS